MAKNDETFQIDTLTGDIRDAVLTEFKQLPKPWQQMTEDEQERLITRSSDIGDKLVRRAVDLIAARGLPALAITVGKFTVDGAELKGTFTAYADDVSLLGIRHLAEKRAMFVLADPSDYMGEQAEAETDVVGDLALPKSGPGAPSDPEALAKVGRGKGKRTKADKPVEGVAPQPDTSNPPFNATDDERVRGGADDGLDIPEGLRRNTVPAAPAVPG